MNEFFKYFNAMMKLTAKVVDFTIEVTYAIIFCFVKDCDRILTLFLTVYKHILNRILKHRTFDTNAIDIF